MKGNKGITLIALVITIIVLLILAGVSIAMLAGNNSILGRAKSTVSANELGEGRDQVGVEWNAAYAEYLDKYYTNKLADGETLESIFVSAGSTPAKYLEQYKDFGNKGFKIEYDATNHKVTITSKSDQSQKLQATITYTTTAGQANTGSFSAWTTPTT